MPHYMKIVKKINEIYFQYCEEKMWEILENTKGSHYNKVNKVCHPGGHYWGY